MAKFRVYCETTRSDEETKWETHTSIKTEADGLSDERKLAICRAGAEVLLRRLREYLEANTHDPNRAVRGRLAESLGILNLGSFCHVEPLGKHHGSYAKRTRAEGYRRAKTGQGKGRSNKSAHHGLSSGISAMDVGYYLEYGTPRMAATHWMENTVEASEEEVLAAMQDEFNRQLDEMGL